MSCNYDPNCKYEKPDLGFQTLPGEDSVGTILVEIAGVAMAVGGFLGSLETTSLIIARIAGELGLGLVAAAAVWVIWGVKCVASPKGHSSPCLAGIVDSLVPPATTHFSSAIDFDPASDVVDEIEGFAETHTDIFPFMKEHPCFNLVVSCKYWNVISNDAGFVWFNGKGEPYIPCFIKDPSLCQKLFNSAVGATLGGIGGVVAAWWADAAALAICGASVFCAIFAILIGAVVALVCALVGAKLGFELGGVGSVSYGPPDPATTQQATQPVRVGDYVAVKGNMVKLSWLQNSNALWFVEEWCWYFHEDAVQPPFTHMMARDFFQSDDPETSPQDKEYLFCKMGVK